MSKQAHNYIKNDMRGIAVGGLPFGYSELPNGIWVDCIMCSRRDRLSDTWTDGDLSRMTDDEAVQVFTAHGWTVLPTVCPDCG